MHGWYDLCFYGASQLFPLCDLLSPSGMSLTKIFFFTRSMFVQILLEQGANLNNEFITSVFFKGQGKSFPSPPLQKKKNNIR
jgi:hypothetical protein